MLLDTLITELFLNTSIFCAVNMQGTTSLFPATKVVITY